MHYCTAPAFGPRVRTLDGPAFWQDHESGINLFSGCGRLGTVVQASRPTIPWAPYDFNANVVQLLDAPSAFVAARAIGVELFKAEHFRNTLMQQQQMATSRSCTLAAVTVSAMTKPIVSTTRLRFRPLTFFAASKPLTPPCGEI